MVPKKTVAVIPANAETDFRDLLQQPFIPILDEITPSVMQLPSSLFIGESSGMISIDALLMYPDTSTDWQPVWIGKTTSGTLEQIHNHFTKKYQQNSYQYSGQTIFKAFISDKILFFTEINGYTVLSESSLAIEDIVRTTEGELPALTLTHEQKAGDIIINTTQLSTVALHLSAIKYRPWLQNLFKGAEPMSMTFLPGETEGEWTLSGFSAIDNSYSEFIRLLNSEPAPFRLHRYIPVDVAAFGIFRDNPIRFDSDSISSDTPADNYLRQNESTLRRIKSSLGNEAAIALFSESGPASESEYLFLREISDPGPVRSLLESMADNELAIRDGNTFFISSTIIGKLFGSYLYPEDNFYLVIYDDVAALALRKGLAESVGSDAERRRVLFYDEEYRSFMQSFSTPLSSMFYADAARFSTFIQPWLFPQHYASPLLNEFDRMAVATRFNTSSQSLEFIVKNFESDETEEPYREQWVYPLNGADLTGPPVFANITGSTRQEIIFSTRDGSVFAVAADGTTILQTSTGSDVPTGPPVVYDWYGNSQPVILQAASSNIYAWNSNGDILPNFPISLDEEITTPLTVQDVLANGVPEIVVATANRNIHLLNTRGLPVNGWPQSTNSIIYSRPLIADFDGLESIFAFSENTLHSWNLNGQRREGFPVFLPTQINSRPVLAESHLLGAGLDGGLYAIGTRTLFSDSLSTVFSSDSLTVESISVSSSGLTGTPVYTENMMIRTDQGLERDNTILLQSANGSVFLYSLDGELLLTQNMGQPASTSSAPFIADINSDDRLDIVATASFGRLYAWDILSGERHLDLPTAAMANPVISDFDDNGFAEILTQTREGLQSWTIFFTRRESLNPGQ